MPQISMNSTIIDTIECRKYLFLLDMATYSRKNRGLSARQLDQAFCLAMSTGPENGQGSPGTCGQ